MFNWPLSYRVCLCSMWFQREHMASKKTNGRNQETNMAADMNRVEKKIVIITIITRK